MLRRTAFLLAVLTAALPAAADYRSAPELFDAMLEAQRTRGEGVSDYAMDVELMSQPSTQYFERVPTEAADGRSLETFRLVPFDEVRRRLQGEPGISPEALQAYADGLARSGGGGMMPPGLAKKFRAGATGTDSGAGPWALQEVDRMASLAERAEIVGRETLDGRSAYRIAAEDLNLTQVADGNEFVVRSIDLWVDADDLLMLKMHAEGEVKQDGQSRDISIERIDRDYRNVPGSGLILPYHTILRMGGMLGPKEQKELEDARRQLAELDRQMASMPPAQQGTMKSMMGPQIEMLRKMVDGGAFEVETTVREIRVNQGLAGALARAPRFAPGAAASIPANAVHSSAGDAAPSAQDAEALQRAREACLQQKITQAQTARKKKRRFGRLLGAVGRIAGRHGGGGLAADIGRVSNDVYAVGATTRDLEVAAEALGITQDDIAALREPSMTGGGEGRRHPMALENARRAAGALMLVALAGLLPAPPAGAQWAAQPGETKRDSFGPARGRQATLCRGACGAGCPSTCAESVAYECLDATLLRRVEIYECGTHLGCREHDDCLDACTESGLANLECQTQCHQKAVERFGFETATSWASGQGPYDGPSITYEYTRDAPDAPEPAFRCPDGARRECSGAAGRCLTAGGSTVAPVFDSYPAAGDGAMSVSGFRAGRLCGNRVCEPTSDIRVTGEDTCDRGDGAASCTRYGVEFDYRNADPSLPLECSTSTIGGKKDFIGDLLVKGLSAMPEPEGGSDGEEPHGMRVLLDVFKKAVTSADSPEDVAVSMAPLGPDGRPIESQRVGTPPNAFPPSTPRTVALTAPSGHLVVPMYQLADGGQDGPLVREIRCSHNGTPVLETAFHLSF